MLRLFPELQKLLPPICPCPEEGAPPWDDQFFVSRSFGMLTFHTPLALTPCLGFQNKEAEMTPQWLCIVQILTVSRPMYDQGTRNWCYRSVIWPGGRVRVGASGSCSSAAIRSGTGLSSIHAKCLQYCVLGSVQLSQPLLADPQRNSCNAP